MNSNVELDVGMINVTLDDDVTDEIVRKKLLEHYTMLKDDFLNQKGIPMYSIDDEMNNELEFNLINALRIACNYFSPQDQKILWK